MNATFTETIVVERQPGNGTRYELWITLNPFGGLNWSWTVGTTTFYTGWASDWPGGEVRTSGKRLGRADRAAIERIMDEARACIDRGSPRRFRRG